jgi:hypothetical protein
MANQPFAMRASGNIIRSRFVMLDNTNPGTGAASGNNVLQATLNVPTIGIADIAGGDPPLSDYLTQSPPYAAQAGENVRVHALGARCDLEIGVGGCVAGDELKPDANGAGVAVGITGKGRVGAIAIAGANQGELVEVEVVRYDKYGAAS